MPSDRNTLPRIRGVLRNTRLPGYTYVLEALSYRLPLIATADVPTAGTDGKKLYFNPAFVEKLSDAELLGLVRHEFKHYFGAHPYRRGDRDPKLWNIACDMVMNTEDKDLGLPLPPDGWYLPKELDTVRPLPSPEEVYDWMQANPDKAPQDGCGAGVELHIMDPASGPGGAPVDAKTQIARVAGEFQDAIEETLGRARGKLPDFSDAQRNLEIVLRDLSTIDWRGRLSRFLSARVKVDYTWSIPSRRFASRGLYLPSNSSPGLRSCLTACDISGSMQESTIERICSDLNVLRRAVSIAEMSFVCFDTRCRDVQKFHLHQPFRPEVWSGGGTSFDPPHALAHQLRPDVFIMLTDGEARNPANPYDPRKTVWVIYDGLKCPEPGLVIHVP